MIGPSRLGGFLVYTFIGYWGLVLFHHAARIGLPSLDERRYAMLLYFMPALVFWPSSIGKEAVMMLAIGCAAFGAAAFSSAGATVCFPSLPVSVSPTRSGPTSPSC